MSRWAAYRCCPPGREDIFTDAGVVVLSNKPVPDGRNVENPQRMIAEDGVMAGAMPDAGAGDHRGPGHDHARARLRSRRPPRVEPGRGGAGAPVLPRDLDLGGDHDRRLGQGRTRVQAPDSITTWMLRAVALSPEKGLGIAEASLKVFQPFFVQVDLPYSAIRGEEFPVKVALYNYLDESQQIQVELGRGRLVRPGRRRHRQGYGGRNDVGSAEFTISPTTIGTQC